MSNHDLNQCWNVINWILRNKLRSNFDRNTFSFKKMHLKMSCGKWWPFCLCLNVLTQAYFIDCMVSVQNTYYLIKFHNVLSKYLFSVAVCIYIEIEYWYHSSLIMHILTNNVTYKFRSSYWTAVVCIFMFLFDHPKMVTTLHSHYSWNCQQNTHNDTIIQFILLCFLGSRGAHLQNLLCLCSLNYCHQNT